MRHQTIIACAILMFAVRGPACSEVWTLDRAVRTAVAASTGAANGRLDARTSTVEATTARSSWYPTVSVTANASYVDKVMELNMPTKSIRFGDNDTYDFKLRLNQLVFDGGRLNALRDAGIYRSEMNGRQAEASELLTEFQAKTAFYSAALAQENVKAAEQSVLEAKNHHADVAALRKEGMALEDDEVFSRLRVSKAEMDIATRRADLDRARSEFRKTLGLGFDADVSVAWAPGSFSDHAPADAEQAFGRRPEFRAYDAMLRSAEKMAAGARAERLPTVGFNGSFSYGKPGLDMPRNEWMHYFTGGLALSWNVWDWGKTGREVEKAEITRMKTLNSIDELRRTVADQVAGAAVAFDEAKKRLSLAEESAAYADRHLELVRASFKNGTATERDYDTAHALATQALYDVASARIALELSGARMDYVLGIRYTGEKP